MKRLFKSFLEENITKEYLYESFDYNFNNTYKKENFLLEYKKFLGIYNTIFYDKNRFVTVFNSNEIRIDKKDIEQLLKLYEYTKHNNLVKEKLVLVDFLLTYYNTINTHEYKNNYLQYKESKGDFMSILAKLNLLKTFFVKFPEMSYNFYKQLINFAFQNDIYIDAEIINRIFNNLKFKQDYYNELIEFFIVQKKNLCNIVSFDKEKEKHKDVYLRYIIESLDTFGGYNYAKEMIFELDKEKSLNEENVKIILNKYVDVVNKIFDKLKDKQYSFIKGISEIENLKNELNYILKNIEVLTDIQKDKIRESISQLLRLKRYLISDDVYVNSEMHKSTHEFQVKSEEIEKYKGILLENEFSIYSASKVDFTTQIETALEFYSEYPIQSLVSNYHIDTEKQIYAIGIEDRKKLENDNFKKYFDEKGCLYTKNHPKLLNKLSKNYYEELLKYLSKTFFMQQDFIILTLGKDNFKNIIIRLKKSIGYDYDNDYATIVNNILAIEKNIIDFMKKINLEWSDDGFSNINNLFEYYKNDKDVLNGLMYLNYVLYEKSGFNLRNNIMHGTLINSNLEVSLLISFSGLIFVSWLLNAR